MKPVVSQLCAGIILALGFTHDVSGAGTNPGAGVTDGWKPMPFTHEIQHPFDLKMSDRYDFDATNGIHHFWIRFTDKPHAPPPNKTNARSEMKLANYRDGEFMFDGDVMISPGTSACIGQVFDAAHGPVAMVVAHPDGTVTVQVHDLPKVNDLVSTNAIGHWWNLKMQNDTREGGQVKIYVDNVLVGTYPGRGPREYYFKCGVYSREGSDLSDVRYRNIKMWMKANP
ncbi:MAG TPA: polysaccharide lyase family 7 protein [Candidatus Acidoferrales bacterium]|jgi:hypothetical protein|nr:polysaccharide lyase family 7 protein [Candidatus Acidoferrales bacterium]